MAWPQEFNYDQDFACASLISFFKLLLVKEKKRTISHFDVLSLARFRNSADMELHKEEKALMDAHYYMLFIFMSCLESYAIYSPRNFVTTI